MHSETQRGPLWMRILGIVVAVGTLAIVIPAEITLAAAGGSIAYQLVLMGGGTVAVVGGMVLGMGAIRVTVSEHELRAHILPFRVFKLRKSEIVSSDTAQISPRDAGGLGYRITPSGRFLLWDAGPAVQIRTLGGRSYYLRSPNPAALQAQVENLRS